MFGFRCQECAKGTVRETTVRNLEIKFQRIPFVVPRATIGVCDACGAEHFDAKEYKRWRKLFEKEQSRVGGILSPADIRALRSSLGMSMSDFAALIGTTRQSLHHWEKDEREVPQSRMTDMMLSLVREGVRSGAIKVVEFLYQRARSAGIDISMPNLTPEREAHEESVSGHEAVTLAELDEYDGAFDGPAKESGLEPRLAVFADEAA